jgi:tRNA-splicing ligase RtcB
VGTDRAVKESFGSVCHGAGRKMSRHAAKRGVSDADVARDLAAKGIVAIAASRGGLAEEASEAYKDVAEVVEVCHRAGLCKRVVKTYPLGVVKG